MKYDFLIIGQGLAGSLLAWALIERGCKVIVVDNDRENASLVAAGIINPITGMRFIKAPDLETLLPAAQRCYEQLSAFFGQPFYANKPMFRVFRDEIELAHCKKRQTQADYKPYLGNFIESTQGLSEFSTPFGGIEQRQCGHLLTVALLNQFKQFFKDSNAYRHAELDYQALQLDSGVHWQDISAKYVVFCEGYYANQNPWFSWLPFQPAKGEILTLSHASALPNALLNYGNWLLPLAADTVRVGATFDWTHIDTQCTEQGKQLLLKRLYSYSPKLAEATLVAHQTGIRPCTLDKQPFIGKHPNYNQIAIFNGFGAKGSLQIPWYSQCFADFLLNNSPLPTSCDIQRYQSSHFPG